MKSSWKWSGGKCESIEPLGAEDTGIFIHSEALFHSFLLAAHRTVRIGEKREKASLTMLVWRSGGASTRERQEVHQDASSHGGGKPYVTGRREQILLHPGHRSRLAVA